MKKLIALFMSLVCVITLGSCGWNSQKVVASVIGENVTKIEITHHIGGRTTTWGIEGEEIDTLREWFNNLSYKHLEVKGGQSPGDNDGGEVYSFALTGGEWPGFSYVINSENDCYIQSEGNWFTVTNPSDPPVTEPADIVSFRAKVLEVNDDYLLVEPVADSDESKSADKIEVPLAGKTSWPIPAVGDTVNIFYSGGIQETYPARITKVHRVEIETAS